MLYTVLTGECQHDQNDHGACRHMCLVTLMNVTSSFMQPTPCCVSSENRWSIMQNTAAYAKEALDPFLFGEAGSDD